MSERREGHPVDILLVEDCPADADLAREALEESKISNELTVIEDGVTALQYLRKEGPYASASTPDLILMDLNIPRKDGKQVLAEIKDDDLLKTIPVVILTTSRSEQDILKTYQLHANCYITKPIDLDQFATVVKAVENFWLTIVKLPPKED